MISIESLIRPISSDQLYETLVDVLERVQIPARSWRKGSVARSILGAVAEVGSQGAALVSSAVAGGFLLLAKGDWLKSRAKDVYDVDFVAATYATGKVTLSNTGGAVYTIGADELIVRSSSTKARYRVTQAFVLGSGSELVPT